MSFQTIMTMTLKIYSSDNNPIITTEKDAVKIMALLKQYPDFKQDIWVVPVDAVLSPDCYTVLQQQLQQYGIQIS